MAVAHRSLLTKRIQPISYWQIGKIRRFFISITHPLDSLDFLKMSLVSWGRK